MSMGAEGDRFLAIYLNDHLAGATLGVELARRLVASNHDDEMRGALTEICAEIEADRATLEDVMKRMGVPRGRLKPALAWVSERLGRLKPNGRLTGYSPLSRVVELELLYIGITGKMRLWRALEQTRGSELDEIDPGRLAERAAEQRARLEELHLKATRWAFVGPPDGEVR